MKLGISTYAFFWHVSEKNPSPSSIEELLDLTKEYGGEVFQICDYPSIETMEKDALLKIKDKADQLGIELEVGTRGVRPNHLNKYIDIAETLGATFLRTMFNRPDDQPTSEEAYESLMEVLPVLEEKNISIGLETYEQVKTQVMVDVVKKIDSPLIGICLDPANTIAALEMPQDVVDIAAPYVTNLHVKDFDFSRHEGWVGFNLLGRKLGEGKLDLNYSLKALKENNIDVNAIIELWLPFTNTIEETLELEKQWTRDSLHSLRGIIK